MDDDTPGVANAWKIVDKALHDRRLKWADLGKHLRVSDQVLSNWKARKTIPPSRYLAIGSYLGWSVEEVTGHAPEPARPVAVTIIEPTYSKRANDIAKMFDEIIDADVRKKAYALVSAQLQMAKAGQRLPDLVPAPTPKPKSPQPAPPPKKGPQQHQ